MARLSLTVTEETIDRLRDLAAEYGLLARSGRFAGQGNISELLDAIAEGRLHVVSEDSAVFRLMNSATTALTATAELVDATILAHDQPDRSTGVTDWMDAIANYQAAMERSTAILREIGELPNQVRLPLVENDQEDEREAY